MIFRSISKAPLTGRFNPEVLVITLLSVLIACFSARGLGMLARVERCQFGTFLQSTFHGNIGYIALAVAYYHLGDEGLVRAGIIGGFVMILQNMLAVFVLQLHSGDAHVGRRGLFLKVAGNPVILSAVAGILFSLSGLTLPMVAGRSLDILSGMALPTALLIIGASLSFGQARRRLPAVLLASSVKLLLLPGLGLVLYRMFCPHPQEYLPGLILLASPTATITYVMAKEMGGDADLSVAVISASTMLSAMTFSLWLNMG